jgi:histidinol-phosphatase
MNYKPYLDFTTDLAYRAGRVTLGYFQTGIPVVYKSDNTPVTAADHAAEEFIREQIEMNFPDHVIIGEEFGETAQKGKSIRWIIDPIDGTKSFMRGIPLYAVLIGLEIDGIVRVGAAYFPALDEMLCAADGEGCWWNGRRAHVSSISELEKAYICYTSMRENENSRRSQVWARLKEKAFVMRGWSDAYGYLAVATGRAEAMLDPVMAVWDCGPFPAIFREAGGYFGGWDGKEGHQHGEALACNSSVLPELLALVKSE